MPKLTKRGNVWWYSFSVDGQRFRRSAKTSDRRLAEDIASKDEWRHRHAAVHGAESVLTFGEAVALYHGNGKDNRFLLPLLDRWEKVRVKDITPQIIRQAARDMYPGRSTATWNRQVITPARAIINYAAESGLCPHIRVKRFPEEKKAVRPGSREWLAAFQKAAHSPNLAALARFMFETGARIGEATRLRWEDVNLQEGIAAFGKTKNGDPHVAYLSPAMVAELANLGTEFKVFGYSSRHSVYNGWHSAIDRAGIERLGPHQAGRHGFGTEMIVRNGIDVATTGKLGNWKSLRLLMETYAHPERERETILKVFGPKTTQRRAK